MDAERQNMNNTAPPLPPSGLPQSMRYAIGSKRAVSARCSHLNFQPFNGNSFTPDSNNEIRINIQAPGFLDTAKHILRFSVAAVTTTAAANIDYSLASLFDQLRIESNGTVLERIDRYSVIDNIKSMYNDSFAEKRMKSSTALGNSTVDVKSLGTAFDTTGSTVTGSIQLRSGLLMSKHGHALPMGGPPIELILRLNSAAACLFGAATSGLTSVTVSNVAFLCPMYQIDSESIMAQYKQVLATQPITICGETYKTYVNSVVASSSTQVLQINDRSRSLKALVSAQRPSGNSTTYIAPSNSEFVITGVDRYTYNIAGAQYPPGGIQMDDTLVSVNVCEAMDQAGKALAPYNQLRGHGLVGVAEFAAPVSAAANKDGGGKAVMSIDLRRFSDEERCFVGMDTASNAQPITLELQCTSSTAGDLSTFAIVEAEWVLQGGRYGVSV